MAIALTRSHRTLSRVFSSRGIPAEEIAFYNHAAFRAAEGADPAFLEFYCAWVRARPRQIPYDAHVRSIVPRIAELVANEIVRDGQLGVCIDASMMLTKMLEQEGIWCYAAKGALTISAPDLGHSTHFCMFDDEPAAGHFWVVAPPFEIIDVSLKNQRWKRGEGRLMPSTIVLETATRIVPRSDDFMSDSVLSHARKQHGPLPRDFHFRAVPSLARPAQFFPSWEVKVGETTLRYACGTAVVSEAQSLYTITSRRWNGRLAGELYDEVVRPALKKTEKPTMELMR